MKKKIIYSLYIIVSLLISVSPIEATKKKRNNNNNNNNKYLNDSSDKIIKDDQCSESEENSSRIAIKELPLLKHYKSIRDTHKKKYDPYFVNWYPEDVGKNFSLHDIKAPIDESGLGPRFMFTSDKKTIDYYINAFKNENSKITDPNYKGSILRATKKIFQDGLGNNSDIIRIIGPNVIRGQLTNSTKRKIDKQDTMPTDFGKIAKEQQYVYLNKVVENIRYFIEESKNIINNYNINMTEVKKITENTFDQKESLEILYNSIKFIYLVHNNDISTAETLYEETISENENITYKEKISLTEEEILTLATNANDARNIFKIFIYQDKIKVLMQKLTNTIEKIEQSKKVYPVKEKKSGWFF